MKKILIIILICVVFIVLAGVYLLWAPSYFEWMFEKFAPKFTVLDEKYPDDLEIQEGLLFLQYVHLAGSHECSLEERCERILVLDPNNHAAWALKAYLAYRHYTVKRRHTIGLLESVLENARKQKLEKIRVSSYSRRSIMDTLNNKKEDERYISIEDFFVVIEQRREEFDLELTDVFEVINKGQRNDSENALYNYLKAHIYLIIGENESAIKEVEEGATKKVLSINQEETSEAARKVLRKVWFPPPHRFIIGSRPHFEEFIYDMWNPYPTRSYCYERRIGLCYLGRSYEAKGEFKKAEKLYKLTERIALQTLQEKHMLWGLLEKARKRLEELHDKMPMGPEMKRM